MCIPVWNTSDDDFRETFDALTAKLSLSAGITAAGSSDAESPQVAVRRIVEDVRARGNDALLEYLERFDGCVLQPEELVVTGILYIANSIVGVRDILHN